MPTIKIPACAIAPLVKSTGAKLVFQPRDKLHETLFNSNDKGGYDHQDDTIYLPDDLSFTHADDMRTVLHELIHWTGSRVMRVSFMLAPLSGSNTGAFYALEELIAEMGAVFLGIALGVDEAPSPTSERHLANWFRPILNAAGPKMAELTLMSATQQASRAVKYLLDTLPAEAQRTAFQRLAENEHVMELTIPNDTH